MKALVPPKECGVSISFGTFCEQLCHYKKKTPLIRTYSTVRKRANRERNNIVETTPTKYFP